MSKKRARRAYTVEEKLRILEEARQPNTAVAEVLRRHQVDAATFYRWERQAKEGMKEALEGRKRDAKGQEQEIERLRAELAKKSRIIAEVVEENLWPAPAFSTRGYESVSSISPSPGESKASPATRGSEACWGSVAANSAGVRSPRELCGRSRLW
ncbi:MAG: transposase [Longimicrobiales bacterium]